MAEPPSATHHRLTDNDWDYIYSRVPRLCVELIVRSDAGVLLTLRNIEPCKDQWHIPGGTVQYGETLVEAVVRIARRELDVTCTNAELLGYLDYPSHFLHGLGAPVGIAFGVAYEGEVTPNHEAKQWGWFRQLPSNMHADQDAFLAESGFVTR